VPELPEVETVRRQLAPIITGRRVLAAGAHPSAKFAPATDVVGAGFLGIDRRGKYLLAQLDDDRQLIVHLGMTGVLRPLTGAAGEPTDPYVRAWWALDDGTTVELKDVRRFGRIAVVPTGDHRTLATLHHLGPEPLGNDFTPEGLHRDANRSAQMIKSQLMGQRLVAGVGNIYADEALWRAGVNPVARTLSRPRAVALHAAIRDVLAAALANGGTTLRDYRDVTGEQGTNQFHLSCYGRSGEPCLRCGVALRRRVIDGRGTTWCPTCQRR
jgi:formamidopyrimidine-DNA glycosylase